jgi:lipoate-protein ligase A
MRKPEVWLAYAERLLEGASLTRIKDDDSASAAIRHGGGGIVFYPPWQLNLTPPCPGSSKLTKPISSRVSKDIEVGNEAIRQLNVHRDIAAAGR